MIASHIHYFPVAWPVLLVLAVLVGALGVLLAARVLTIVSASMGIRASTMIAILAFSLAGSYVNIPVAYIPERQLTSAVEITYFGIPYVIPVVQDWPATVVAVNVGGAIVPVLLSLYLIVRNRIVALSLVDIAIVAFACHLIATPVPGLGIALPVFVPPLVTAVSAVLLSRRHAAPLAYVGGSLGTLIGADLLNLDKIQGLGAPVASIGGAGTFDGIFVTGLVAVVYAAFATRRVARGS